MRCGRFLKRADRGEIYFSLCFGSELNLLSYTAIGGNGLKFMEIL